MIPLKYNTRNLQRRWVATLMTVLATGFVVWSSCLLFGLVAGLRHSLNVTGDPLDLIILRKGSTNETDSSVDYQQLQELRTLQGVAVAEDGTPLVSGELLYLPLMRRNDGDRANVTIRGTDPHSQLLRPRFTIIAGSPNKTGVDECIVGKNLSGRFQGARLGDVFRISSKEAYRVAGVFSANGSSAESEIWVDRRTLERNTQREGAVSSVHLRARSTQDLARLRNTIDNDKRLNLRAVPEAEYFAKQSTSSTFLTVSGTIIAILLTFGAMFAAANTMFAAVASRTREIGTMRALGFSRGDVLFSFLFESLLLCTLGGLLGLAATVPLSALTFGTFNADTFSETSFAFRLDGLVIGVALAMTLAMGVVGGMFPALRAVKLDVVKALREL